VVLAITDALRMPDIGILRGISMKSPGDILSIEIAMYPPSREISVKSYRPFF
jgi:hypothetical protein